MSKSSLADQRYELIKGHILNPDDSPLPVHLQAELDRVISMTKVMDKHPILKHAVALHQAKYPELSSTTAYRDAKLARQLYHNFQTFDFDFWQTWIINDIVASIDRCRKRDTATDDRVIALQHANLLKAIGERPEALDDPTRNEKHNFYIMVNIDNKNVKLDINNLHKLPENTIRELNKVLMGGQTIDDVEAAEIMES